MSLINPEIAGRHEVAPETDVVVTNRENLGYNPLPAVNTLAEKLVRQRTSLGLAQKESARRIGVDPGTLARWERGGQEPAGVLLGRAEGFLDDAEAGPEARRVG